MFVSAWMLDLKKKRYRIRCAPLYFHTHTLHIVCPINDICTFFAFNEFCPVVTDVAVEFCPVADVAVESDYSL